MKIIYENCGVKNMEDQCSYERNSCSCEKKSLKKFKLVWEFF